MSCASVCVCAQHIADCCDPSGADWRGAQLRLVWGQWRAAGARRGWCEDSAVGVRTAAAGVRTALPTHSGAERSDSQHGPGVARLLWGTTQNTV